MRSFRLVLGLVACFLSLGVVPARADPAPGPLNLVPAQADFFLALDHPRAAVERVTGSTILQQLRELDAVREFLDSTNYRRFYQLVAYFEQQLGLPWPELLDRVAGRGAVLAVKIGTPPAPVLLVIQGNDDELARKFYNLGLTVLEQELARQDGKVRLEKSRYRHIDTVRAGQEFHAAFAGSAIFISNAEKALQHALDLHLDGGRKSVAALPTVAEARKTLSPEPLAWLWLNLDTVHKAPQAKEIFVLPRNDTNLTVLFGGLLDVVGRSPFLCGGLYPHGNGFLTSIRMPRGRDGMAPAIAVHVPPAGKPGSLPLLEPRGVLYSSSYYLDLSKFWEDRSGLFNDKQRNAFEEFDKNSGRFLAGNRVSQLLSWAGPHQRVVIANPSRPPYKVTPGQRFPAFAVVVDMRDPKFGKAMETVLRGAAFFAGFQLKLNLVEDKEGDVAIVGYRFPEDADVGDKDVNNVRFNFSPCFARVGDQFVACSTLELCHELVKLVQGEKGKAASAAALQTRVYAQGGAEALQATEDQLFTQTVLNQGLPPAAASEQVRLFLDLLHGMGVLQNEIRYGANTFQFDIRLKMGKP